MDEVDVVVDTHALIWAASDRTRLGAAAAAAIDDATSIGVAAISFWEIAMLMTKGRIRLDRSVKLWRRDALASGAFVEIPLAGTTAIDAAQLNEFHGDPADRIVVATALSANAALISRDQAITRWSAGSALDVIW